MNLTPHPYARLVHDVEKPARYLGGEFNAVVGDWNRAVSRFCLAFPDVYDIGMSHLGTRILYAIVNRTDDLLMERCFTPWPDMERQLRAHSVPLLSLESYRPLRDFDVVGFSFQYEMTYTNALTMLDLGGIPLRNADRTLEHPLIIAGGPSVTHPEPMAPFVDLFLVGDAEERLPRLLRHWAALKAEGTRTRLEMIAEIAREGGVYAPDLYELDTCERTGFLYVARSRFAGVPDRVQRAFLDDISRFRFPDDSPVAVAEAVFDRMGIEIARGCTEGCRFCQAGMIYRPVRERDPEEVIETVLSAIEKGGYDEVSITALSTADYSCISPLIRKLMERLRERRVSLGISSLRAYGLTEDLLDEVASVKATGLTFAPEAGTQRMRDVINKNISEEDIFATCHRVFSKGWQKVKLYFMVGLPTETDDDVLGIAKMGRQAWEIGRQYHRRGVDVIVSVSSHVPKPHTPFQWAAMDPLETISAKQATLRDLSKIWKFAFRRHDARISWLECIAGRGDRRVGDLIERVWRKGARFDGWDKQLKWDAWLEAIAEWEADTGVDHTAFFGTLPTDARLPWDHIDVGLEDGFLLREYRKALANRLSPPCGKPKGAQVHHTNLVDAHADERKLVCYNCGVACDMSTMRTERLDFLEKLGATEPPVPRLQNARDRAQGRLARGLAPNDFGQGRPDRYRLQFGKGGAACFQGHLDVVRMLPRIFRRAHVEVFYSEGFSPRPQMVFGPALGLGASSLSEMMDVEIIGGPEPRELLERLNLSAPDGLTFVAARRLVDKEPELGEVMHAYDWLLVLDPESLPGTSGAEWLAHLENAVEAARADRARLVHVERKGRPSPRRLWDAVLELSAGLATAEEAVGIGKPVLRVRMVHDSAGSMRPGEIVASVLGESAMAEQFVRSAAWTRTRAGYTPVLDGPEVSRLTLEAIADLRAAHRARAMNAMVPNATPSLLELAGRG